MFEWLRKLIFGRFYKAEDSISQAADAYNEYNHSHQPSDLEKTIEHYRDALAQSNEKHDHYASILINLAVALTELGEIQSSDASVTVDTDRRYREPIELLTTARNFMESISPANRPSTYPTILISLGRLYLNRYRDTKVEDDLQASVEAYKQAQSTTPPGSLPHCTSLIEHAAALWTACELQPKTDDTLRLEQALAFLDEARKGNHRELEGECDKHLAAVHDLLYRETGTKNLKKAMTHLNSAIELNQSSVRLLRVRSADPALSSTLLNLARQQFARYIASTQKDEADLHDAEMNYQEARVLAEQEHGSLELLERIDRLANNIKQYKKTATFRRGSADQY